MIVSPFTPAQLAAQNLVNQANNITANMQEIITNGLPARAANGNNPAIAAIPAADIVAALGTALPQIQAIIAAA